MTDGQRSSNISPAALALAAIASASATFVISRFGLAGTLIGAALLPVLIALITEFVRRPTARFRRVRASEAGRPSVRTYRSTRPPLPWGRVLLTGGAAFALVVGAFTLAELALGESVTSKRRTTFFNSSDSGARNPPRTTTQTPVTFTVPDETAPPTTTTEPQTTTTETETTPTEPPADAPSMPSTVTTTP